LTRKVFRETGPIGRLTVCRERQQRLDELPEIPRARSAGGRHQQRENRAARGGHLLEPARQTGEIGTGTGRRGLDREDPALHLLLGPGKPAAGEHGVTDVRRRREPCDPHVEPLSAHRRHRHHRGAEPERERLARVDDAGGQCRARKIGAFRRHREARAVAAEHEGEIVRAHRIGDAGDDGGARHVHCLVSARRDRRGRARHVRESEKPVVRQRHVEACFGYPIEAAEDRNGRVEIGRAAARAHGLRLPPLVSSSMPRFWPIPGYRAAFCRRSTTSSSVVCVKSR
jgi:hypothetical protein